MRKQRFFTVMLITILSAVSFNLYGNDTIVYHYAGSLVKDGYFTDNSTIKINSNNPACIIIMPQGMSINIKQMESTRLIDDDLWEEVYATNIKRTSITLHKQSAKGITMISLHKGDNIICFEADKLGMISAGAMPSVFINGVLFANIDKHGKVINDYCEPIVGERVKYLAQKIRYQTLNKNSEIKLNVKLLYPNGELMTDPSSANGFSYCVAFKPTADSSEQLMESWQGKFGKGYRMEIYNDNRLLVSVSIPTTGTFVYRPILTKMSGYGYAPIPKPKGRSLDSYYHDLYSRGYTGKLGDYIITGWRVIEQ